jgi:hypothetical protein
MEAEAMGEVELRALKSAQEGRAAKFAELDAAFRQLLHDGDDTAYSRTAQALTPDFVELSEQVNAAERSLRASGSTAWADSVRTLQEREREKLTMTCTLHVLRREYSRSSWSWQHSPSSNGLQLPHVLDAHQHSLPSSSPSDDQTNDRPSARNGDCPQHSGPSHAKHPKPDPPAHNDHRSRGCHQAVEPTEHEYENALQEATQRLEDAVEGINDFMDEVQEALSSLTIDADNGSKP